MHIMNIIIITHFTSVRCQTDKVRRTLIISLGTEAILMRELQSPLVFPSMLCIIELGQFHHGYITAVCLHWTLAARLSLISSAWLFSLFLSSSLTHSSWGYRQGFLHTHILSQATAMVQFWADRESWGTPSVPQGREGDLRHENHAILSHQHRVTICICRQCNSPILFHLPGLVKSGLKAEVSE